MDSPPAWAVEDIKRAITSLGITVAVALLAVTMAVAGAGLSVSRSIRDHKCERPATEVRP